MLKLTVLIYFSLSVPLMAAETCSRVAVINYQEVLVDVSSKNRGEGLRYYLDKDPTAKELLDDYQKNNRPTWQSAALSTAGVGMILGGMLITSSHDDSSILNR